MPNTILGKVMLLPRGEYDPKVQYNRLDVVSYMGDGFIVKRNVVGVTPIDGDDYMLLCDNGIPVDGTAGTVLYKTTDGVDWGLPSIQDVKVDDGVVNYCDYAPGFYHFISGNGQIRIYGRAGDGENTVQDAVSSTELYAIIAKTTDSDGDHFSALRLTDLTSFVSNCASDGVWTAKVVSRFDLYTPLPVVDGVEGQVLVRGTSQTDTRWMAVATGEDAVAMLAELGFVEPLIDENSVLLDGNSVLL